MSPHLLSKNVAEKGRGEPQETCDLAAQVSSDYEYPKLA